jgi:hypothetical protein
MPNTVLGDIASWYRLFLATKPFHMWVNVDRLACPLHRPMTSSRSMRGQRFLSVVALSHHAKVGSSAFLESASPSGLDIQWSVNRLGTCVIES